MHSPEQVAKALFLQRLLKLCDVARDSADPDIRHVGTHADRLLDTYLNAFPTELRVSDDYMAKFDAVFEKEGWAGQGARWVGARQKVMIVAFENEANTRWVPL